MGEYVEGRWEGCVRGWEDWLRRAAEDVREMYADAQVYLAGGVAGTRR